MGNQAFFEGREIRIATMHGKEKVIGPALEEAFKMKYSVAAFDTDLLGTFSGEVERVLKMGDLLGRERECCLLVLNSVTSTP